MSQQSVQCGGDSTQGLSLTVIWFLSLISWCWWLENIWWIWKISGWRGEAAEGGAGQEWSDVAGLEQSRTVFYIFFFHPSDSLTPSHKPRDEHWELHASISSIYYIKPQGCFNSPFHSASISKILAPLPLPLLQWQLWDIPLQVLLFFRSTFS